MDKSCQSSADSTSTITTVAATGSNTSFTTHTRDHHLRQLNKLSQKISKPIIKKPTFDSSQNQKQNHIFNNHNQVQVQGQAQQQQQNLQHQPPVYNINKNEFRDVVQKLTGSPAHERISTPPPIQQPKPPSSRLHRIRPPPLAQITNRPPPLLNAAAVARPQPQPQPPNINASSAIPSNPVNAVSAVDNFSGFGSGRPVAPLSPLPPFPTVHVAAESPVSAYLRCLQNSTSAIDSNSKPFSGFSPLAPLVSLRWNNLPPQQGMVPSPTSAAVQLQSQSEFQLPSSPVPFGCLNSPRSSDYPLLSPSLLFSPSPGQIGFPQLPLSPTVPVPSPLWRGL